MFKLNILFCNFIKFDFKKQIKILSRFLSWVINGWWHQFGFHLFWFLQNQRSASQYVVYGRLSTIDDSLSLNPNRCHHSLITQFRYVLKLKSCSTFVAKELQGLAVFFKKVNPNLKPWFWLIGRSAIHKQIDFFEEQSKTKGNLLTQHLFRWKKCLFF